MEDTHSVEMKSHHITIAYVLLFFSVAAFADSTGTGRITLTSLPDSAVFYINGLERTPDEDNGFNVDPGPVLFEIKQRRVVVFSTFFILTATEVQKIPIDCCTGTCALLHVTTEPPGAVLSINGNIVGTTPFLDGFMRPGDLSIMVTRPGYIPVIRRLSLNTDSSEVHTFELEQTQAVKDSLAAAKRALRRKRQILQGSLFGGIGCVALIAGGYFDQRAYRHLQEAQKASEAYDAARSDPACQAAKEEYKSQREQAERPILYRNALYGVVGACLAGFYLSIVF